MRLLLTRWPQPNRKMGAMFVVVNAENGQELFTIDCFGFHGGEKAVAELTAQLEEIVNGSRQC